MTPFEAALDAQASITLGALDEWLRGAPDREIRVTFTLTDGVVVKLHEAHVSKGESLRDAASQVATVLLMGGGA